MVAFRQKFLVKSFTVEFTCLNVGQVLLLGLLDFLDCCVSPFMPMTTGSGRLPREVHKIFIGRCTGEDVEVRDSVFNLLCCLLKLLEPHGFVAYFLKQHLLILEFFLILCDLRLHLY